VGRETPLENRSLQVSGVRSLVLVPTSGSDAAGQDEQEENSLHSPPVIGSVVCLFANGGIGIHDLRRNKWEFQKEAVRSKPAKISMFLLLFVQGHVETVFTCAFRPDDSATLATGSFDGSVKLWSCEDGEPRLLSSTPGRESIVYSVSWAPPPLDLLAAATARCVPHRATSKRTLLKATFCTGLP